jgi:hypothetical protein
VQVIEDQTETEGATKPRPRRHEGILRQSRSGEGGSRGGGAGAIHAGSHCLISLSVSVSVTVSQAESSDEWRVAGSGAAEQRSGGEQFSLDLPALCFRVRSPPHPPRYSPPTCQPLPISKGPSLRIHHPPQAVFRGFGCQSLHATTRRPRSGNRARRTGIGNKKTSKQANKQTSKQSRERRTDERGKRSEECGMGMSEEVELVVNDLNRPAD